MRISDWSSDVCSSDLEIGLVFGSEGLEIVHQARKDEEKRSIEEGRAKTRGKEQPDYREQQIFRVNNERGQRPIDSRPRCFLRMEGIKIAVQPFVDDVIGRRNPHGTAKANSNAISRWLHIGTERVRPYTFGNAANIVSGKNAPSH